MAYDDKAEFENWHRMAKDKLQELLGIPFLRCDDSFLVLDKEEGEDRIQIDFEFQSEEGYFVACSLLLPKQAKEPLPVVICLQGHSTGKHISLGKAKFESDAATIAGGRDFAVRAVKEGFAAVVMDQRYMGMTGQGKNGAPSCGTDNEAMASLLIGRTAIGERVWDIVRLIDIIQNYLTQYVDPERIICLGNSGGGTATFYASCVDERIALSIPSCAVCTYDESIMAMNHCPCNFIPGIRKYFNMGDLGCLIAPRPVILVCGKDDPIFPLSGVKKSFAVMQSAYRKLGKEELCHLVIGNGGHQFYPDDAWPIARKLLSMSE